VLITFVLFNVVGGSPAAMVLGQNAGARSLEEFDDARVEPEEIAVVFVLRNKGKKWLGSTQGILLFLGKLSLGGFELVEVETNELVGLCGGSIIRIGCDCGRKD
jgi:hypothetical protein